MSERSAQILALLAEGRTCRAIADRLGISPQRVSQVAALHGRPIHESRGGAGWSSRPAAPMIGISRP